VSDIRSIPAYDSLGGSCGARRRHRKRPRAIAFYTSIARSQSTFARKWSARSQSYSSRALSGGGQSHYARRAGRGGCGLPLCAGDRTGAGVSWGQICYSSRRRPAEFSIHGPPFRTRSDLVERSWAAYRLAPPKASKSLSTGYCGRLGAVRLGQLALERDEVTAGTCQASDEAKRVFHVGLRRTRLANMRTPVSSLLAGALALGCRKGPQKHRGPGSFWFDRQIITCFSPCSIRWRLRSDTRANRLSDTEHSHRQQNTTVILGEVTGVDKDKKRVLVNSFDATGVPIDYDYLILATGVTHSTSDAQNLKNSLRD